MKTKYENDCWKYEPTNTPNRRKKAMERRRGGGKISTSIRRLIPPPKSSTQCRPQQISHCPSEDFRRSTNDSTIRIFIIISKAIRIIDRFTPRRMLIRRTPSTWFNRWSTTYWSFSLRWSRGMVPSSSRCSKQRSTCIGGCWSRRQVVVAAVVLVWIENRWRRGGIYIFYWNHGWSNFAMSFFLLDRSDGSRGSRRTRRGLTIARRTAGNWGRSWYRSWKSRYCWRSSRYRSWSRFDDLRHNDFSTESFVHDWFVVHLIHRWRWSSRCTPSSSFSHQFRWIYPSYPILTITQMNYRRGSSGGHNCREWGRIIPWRRRLGWGCCWCWTGRDWMFGWDGRGTINSINCSKIPASSRLSKFCHDRIWFRCERFFREVGDVGIHLTFQRIQLQFLCTGH